MSLLEQAWATLPAAYRLPATTPSLAEARAYCERLAKSHYENFHVASWLLPRALRPHFYALYAYCRIADDLADEVGEPEKSLALLDFWGLELEACYAGRSRHPVFVALAETIRECAIPQGVLADLLKAFRQDQLITRYDTWDAVLQYCRFSANPVGRLVLYACGEAGEENFRLSDATCTALQLANFWQDVKRDYAKGRIYVPREDLRRFGVNEREFAGTEASEPFRAMIGHEVARTRALFQSGRALVGRVRGRLAIDLELFSSGGVAVLDAIERQQCDVLRRRPVVSRARKFGLLLKALLP